MATHYLRNVQLLHEIFRIIFHHSNLFGHDLFFLFDFLRSKLGSVKDIREQVQRLGEMLIEDFDVVCGGFARRKGVHFSAKRVNFARNISGGPGSRALKQHMLNKMRVASLRRRFVSRAGIDPDADRDGFVSRDPLANQADPVIQDKFAVQEDYSAVGSFAPLPAGTGIVSFRLRRIFPCLSISSTLTRI